MPRYFIRDPLEAALAAKNHAFRFDAEWSEGVNHKGGLNGADYLFFIHMIQSRCLLDIDDIKYYIADESLALMEPMVGDMGIANDQFKTVCLYDKDSEGDGCWWMVNCDMDFPQEDYQMQIILRNNLPFPKIEVDDE